ncbi:hypothetical protein JQN72_12050 [Phycicoccus sp. CSK15P-2]|uniref:hypothetical protein n=1 Tax=Phycicoccus sp. CSK15P-2 TaxID=2807627 RepID=UPI00194DF50E|nr:hypothetical protein [Phycicoccus sp. CSK15P-2]MBM6404974.1 hypothetical protein [Phycicoccus sp. CSK15P-2]
MTPEEILEKLHAKWEEVERKATALLEAFNNTLQKIARFSGWVAEKAAAFWNNTVVPAWQKAVDWMSEHWNVFGAPWLCFGAAGDWRSGVGQPTSERAGLATKGQLDVDTTWKGTAATRYNDRLGEQERALGAVSEQFAETIAASLTKVGAGIITWWLGIIVGIGILVICLVTATGEAISVFGLPAVPPTVYAGWASFVGGLIIGTGALTTLCLLAKSDLAGARTKLAKFPGGSWPAFGS